MQSAHICLLYGEKKELPVLLVVEEFAPGVLRSADGAKPLAVEVVAVEPGFRGRDNYADK